MSQYRAATALHWHCQYFCSNLLWPKCDLKDQTLVSTADHNDSTLNFPAINLFINLPIDTKTDVKSFYERRQFTTCIIYHLRKFVITLQLSTSRCNRDTSFSSKDCCQCSDNHLTLCVYCVSVHATNKQQKGKTFSVYFL